MLKQKLEDWLLNGDGTDENRGLNEEQKAAVTCLQNTVTAAGAGSGKTFVLARRFAYLVCIRGFRVNEILTLTFTKKATSEMYSRIYQQLKKIANIFQDEDAIQAIKDFHSAKIQTLDSFCSALIRPVANRYGIRPDFSIDEEKVSEILTQQALPFLLTHRKNPAIRFLTKTDSLEEIAKSVFVNTMIKYSNISEPINFEEQFEKQEEIATKSWPKALKKCLDKINDIKNLNASLKPKKTTFLTNLFTLLEEEIPDENNILGICLYLQKLAYIRIPGGKQSDSTKIFIDLVKEIREDFAEVAALTNFLERKNIIKTLIPLLTEFQQTYNRAKRLQGFLTFNDVSHLAVDILKNCHDIRQSEKKTYKAIMIDEFQDDNSLQKNMLYYLAEKEDCCSEDIKPENITEGKLFFVGDEKQSIYRFRGADVTVFRGLAQELKLCNGITQELSYNYRSHPELIAAFNTIFGSLDYEEKEYPEKFSNTKSNLGIFLETEQTDKNLYEASYKKVLAGRNKKDFPLEDLTYKTTGRHIHLCLYDKNEAQDLNLALFLDEKESEAAFVAKKIQQLVKDGIAKYHEIAILFRFNSQQALYEKYLRQAGISYTSDATSGFFQDAPINDICSFLKLCVYPTDEIAYAVLLKSPFAGISQHSMETIFSKGSGIPFNKEDANLLDDNEKKLFLNLCNKFKEISCNAGILPITEILTQLWYELGYRYETIWNKKVAQYSELFDKLFELGRLADLNGKGLVWFVDNLQQIEKESSSLNNMNIPLERDTAVQLMSIHASKGLEFPIVFLAGCHSEGKKNQNSEKVYFNPTWGISINLPKHPALNAKLEANYFFQKAKTEEFLQNKAETRRLLYVGMTRAERELYIVGSYKSETEEKKEEENIRATYSFLNLMQPLLSEYILIESIEKEDTTSEDTSIDDFCKPKKTIKIQKNSPFTMEFIPIMKRNDFSTEKENETKNDFSSKIILAQNISTKYNNKYILKEVIPPKYKSPSDLSENMNFIQGKECKGSYNDAIQKIINSTKKTDGTFSFTYNHFGTAAHFYLESKIKGEKPIFPTDLIQNLTTENISLLHNVCDSLSEIFLNSQIGKEVLDSNWYRSEYKFKMKHKTDILKGSIDLLYRKSNNEIVIVDYKTDSTLTPEKHIAQLTAYRIAISVLFNEPIEKIKCFLFYLRVGTIYDLTDKCISLDKI